MKKIKVLFLLFTWVVLAFAGACGGSDEVTQDEIDDLAALLTLFSEGEASTFDADTTCALLAADVAAINAGFSNVACDSGTVDIVVTVNSCTDSPLSASLTITITFDNCEDSADDLTADGVLVISLTITDTTATGTASSTGITVNGITGSSSGVTFSVDASGNVTCSGSVSVEGSTCTMAADCSTCTL